MREKEDKTLLELTKTCSKILAISKEYSYLWDESDIWGKDNENKHLILFSGFITPPEHHFEAYIRRVGNTDQFVFDGANLDTYFGYSRGLEAKEVAFEIRNSYPRITPEGLKKSFCESLRNPLGKYLANKTLIERLFNNQKR